jgi:hypothetical protein
MLLLNLSLLIDVTFSTPTGVLTTLRLLFAKIRVCKCYGDLRQLQALVVRAKNAFQ